MSHTIAIFDDEPLIVAALTESVDWASLRCSVAGSACDGIAARAVIDRERPDIVITDIVMPGCTGLELVAYCSRRHPDTRFILLSAHSDFAYAQKAIQYGVNDYILKPVDQAQLLDAVRRVLQKLERQRERERHVRRVDGMVSNSLLFEVARYGPATVQWENWRGPEPGSVLCVKLYNLPAAQEAAAGRIQRLYHEVFEKEGLRLIQGSADEQLLFLCPLPPAIDLTTGRRRARNAAQYAAERAGEESGALCVNVLSAPYRTAAQLHEQYRLCRRKMPETFFERACGTLDAGGEAPSPARPVPLEELLHHLSHGNTAEAQRALALLLEQLRENRDQAQAVHILKTLHMQSSMIASRAGMVCKPAMPEELRQENFERMGAAVRDYALAICAYVAAGRNPLDRLRALAEDRFADPGFGLAAAAELLRMNPSYLSRLFKKETGENFIDYLLNVRIRKAQYLLKTTGLRNREVARQVGFEDEHYFGQVFKKRCGMTPRQYHDREGK